MATRSIYAAGVAPQPFARAPGHLPHGRPGQPAGVEAPAQQASGQPRRDLARHRAQRRHIGAGVPCELAVRKPQHLGGEAAEHLPLKSSGIGHRRGVAPEEVAEHGYALTEVAEHQPVIGAVLHVGGMDTRESLHGVDEADLAEGGEGEAQTVHVPGMWQSPGS